MGGNALLKYNVETRRVNKTEFKDIENEIIPKLLTLFARAELVISYKNKETFGDMDILVADLKDTFTPVELQLKRLFPDSKAFYSNSPVYSFEYRDFQVDVIKTKVQFWETSKVYYAYNDLGNLMGRIAHAKGLSYGHEGLKYTYRTETNHVFGEIILSTDTRKIFEYLGYDYDRFLQGFDDLHDIFEYVTTSIYFDTEKFNLDDIDMSHQNRTRNRKRKTFMAFLEYVKTLPTKIYFVGRDKLLHLYKASFYFPEAKLFEQMEELYERERRNKNNHMKFNGNLVMTWTGKTGKELGELLYQYKMSKNNFHEFLEENSSQFIEQDFKTWQKLV